MSGHAFGQDLTVWFFPLVDSEPAEIPAALRAQTPAIHLYATRPSRAAAAAGTGAAATITAWTYDASRKGFSFTVPAVDDPNPSAAESGESYFLAVNFRLTAAEQLQTVVQHLPLERVRSVGKEVSVTENDLRAIFAAVDGVSTSSRRLEKIAEAKRLVRAELTARGFEWCRVHNLDELNSAVAYRALALIMLGELQTQGDKHFVRYVEFKGIAKGLFDSLKFEYDSNNDQTPDTEESADSMMLLLR